MESEWEKERKFEIDKVSPVYLLIALIAVPFGVYFLLSFLSPLVHRITAMKISEIYIYPIKSLRAVKVNEALGTKHGFKHDSNAFAPESTQHQSSNLTRNVYAPSENG